MKKPPDPHLFSFNEPSITFSLCFNGEVPLPSPRTTFDIARNTILWLFVFGPGVNPVNLLVQHPSTPNHLDLARKSALLIDEYDKIRLKLYHSR